MSIFDTIGTLFGSNKSSPSRAANKYLNQIPGTLKPYYDPYITAGRNALPQLEDQFQSLINNPELLLQRLGNTYQQSPGYKFMYDQGMNAIENAAASGGMTGTPQHQQQAGELAMGLANKDFYNYLGSIMGLYGQGLSGLSDINQMGYGASNELAQSLANALLSQSNLAYAGKANTNAALGNTIGTIASFFRPQQMSTGGA